MVWDIGSFMKKVAVPLDSWVAGSKTLRIWHEFRSVTLILPSGFGHGLNQSIYPLALWMLVKTNTASLSVGGGGGGDSFHLNYRSHPIHVVHQNCFDLHIKYCSPKLYYYLPKQPCHFALKIEIALFPVLHQHHYHFEIKHYFMRRRVEN